jgi:hypothetical protein
MVRSREAARIAWTVRVPAVNELRRARLACTAASSRTRSAQRPVLVTRHTYASTGADVHRPAGAVVRDIAVDREWSERSAVTPTEPCSPIHAQRGDQARVNEPRWQIAALDWRHRDAGIGEELPLCRKGAACGRCAAVLAGFAQRTRRATQQSRFVARRWRSVAWRSRPPYGASPVVPSSYVSRRAKLPLLQALRPDAVAASASTRQRGAGRSRRPHRCRDASAPRAWDGGDSMLASRPNVDAAPIGRLTVRR